MSAFTAMMQYEREQNERTFARLEIPLLEDMSEPQKAALRRLAGSRPDAQLRLELELFKTLNYIGLQSMTEYSVCSQKEVENYYSLDEDGNIKRDRFSAVTPYALVAKNGDSGYELIRGYRCQGQARKWSAEIAASFPRGTPRQDYDFKRQFQRAHHVKQEWVQAHFYFQGESKGLASFDKGVKLVDRLIETLLITSHDMEAAALALVDYLEDTRPSLGITRDGVRAANEAQLAKLDPEGLPKKPMFHVPRGLKGDANMDIYSVDYQSSLGKRTPQQRLFIGEVVQVMMWRCGEEPNFCNSRISIRSVMVPIYAKNLSPEQKDKAGLVFPHKIIQTLADGEDTLGAILGALMGAHGLHRASHALNEAMQLLDLDVDEAKALLAQKEVEYGWVREVGEGGAAVEAEDEEEDDDIPLYDMSPPRAADAEAEPAAAGHDAKRRRT